MGCHALLQGIVPTRDRTHVSYISCMGRWVLYCYGHLGSPVFPKSAQLMYQQSKVLPGCHSCPSNEFLLWATGMSQKDEKVISLTLEGVSLTDSWETTIKERQ